MVFNVKQRIAHTVVAVVENYSCDYDTTSGDRTINAKSYEVNVTNTEVVESHSFKFSWEATTPITTSVHVTLYPTKSNYNGKFTDLVFRIIITDFNCFSTVFSSGWKGSCPLFPLY